jgi:hypothetical protein
MSPAARAGARPAAKWIGLADRALAAASSKIKLIRAVTPVDADAELLVAEQAAERGTLRAPRLRYDPPPVSPELLRALEELASFVQGEGPLGPIYAARALELALEASMIAAVGTPRLGQLAALRYAEATPQSKADGVRADALAAKWIDQGAGRTETQNEREHMTCDTGDPESLISLMAAEVGRRHLPMRIVVETGLMSLAATGDGAIFIAERKRASVACAERTVHHEICGHALPRCKALAEPLGIFNVGTARGLDDQEGRALICEKRAGVLDPRRKRELGLRHVSARAVFAGAGWVDIVRLLLDRGASAKDSVRIATRVTRGGAAGTFAGSSSAREGGLAREIGYLPAMIRVERAIKAPGGAAVEAVMARGRIAADVAPAVAAAGERLARRDRGDRDDSVAV